LIFLTERCRDGFPAAVCFCDACARVEAMMRPAGSAEGARFLARERLRALGWRHDEEAARDLCPRCTESEKEEGQEP